MRTLGLNIFFLWILLFPVNALASLSGAAEYSWLEREYEQGRTHATASHLVQQYHVVYNKSAALGDRRLGHYALSLGGEYNALKTEYLSTQDSIRRSKILYSGHVNIAPGALPFKLSVYAKDLKRSRFANSNIVEDDQVSEGIYRDLINGTRQSLGATLLVGIRNGSYLGSYRDILSRYPRLLIDYSETNVKDVKTPIKEHYRDRNLAFISLNKKDNWLHYRMRTYENYLKPSSNSYTKTFMLGTIDHLLSRRWIKLTNWIQVSVDGSFSNTKSRMDNAPKDSFSLNLLSRFKRKGYHGSSFTTYRRIRKEDVVHRAIRIPLNLHANMANGHKLDVRTHSYRQERVDSEGTVSHGSLFAAGELEGYQTRSYMVSPYLSAEKMSGEDYDVVKLESRLSFKRKSLDTGTFSGSLRFTMSDGTDAGKKVAVRQGLFSVQASQRINSRLSVREGGALSASKGGTSRFSENISTNWAMNVYADVTARFNRTRSNTRLNFSFSKGSSSYSFIEKIGVNNRFMQADLHMIFTKMMSENHNIAAGSRATKLIRFRYKYTPSKVWNLLFDSSLRGNDIGLNESMLKQELGYSVYKVNGIVRKIIEVSEEFTLSRSRDLVSGSDWRQGVRLTLRARYYPTSYSYLYSNYSYSNDSLTDAVSHSLGFGGGLKFSKLKISFGTTFGTGDSNMFEDKFTKKTVNVNILKTF